MIQVLLRTATFSIALLEAAMARFMQLQEALHGQRRPEQHHSSDCTLLQAVWRLEELTKQGTLEVVVFLHVMG